MKNFSALTVSEGFAFGPAYLLQPTTIKSLTTKPWNKITEIALLESALVLAAKDLLKFKEKSLQEEKIESVEILEAHLMLLQDPEVSDMTTAEIENGMLAFAAYAKVIEHFRQLFLQVEDEIIKQRAIDLSDICRRVLFYINNPNANYPDLKLESAAIIVAADLTPSQILSMDKALVLGIITVEGAPTSHTAILARSLEIPCLVAVDKKILAIQNGDKLALNGATGQLLVNASENDLNSFLEYKKNYDLKKEENLKLKGLSSETTDGIKISLAANISGPQDLPSFFKNDGEAIGLYRTEFLFLDRDKAPSEEEQYQVYKKVFDGLKGKHILVRTLDIGGDKQAAYLNMKHEENPFLGVRAIRLCFQRPDIFKTQLRALLRAGANANWGLMLPMISQLEELVDAKEFIAQAKKELYDEKKPYSLKEQIGIMVEIPSAAWMIEILAKNVDFISIGTNDLLQYTCAADRLNPDLMKVYNPYNIGFLVQMHHIIKSCKNLKVHTGICGSLSHHADLMPFFIGCGINELSMTSQHILPAKKSIRYFSYTKCQQLVKKVLTCSTSDQTKTEFINFHSDIQLTR